MPAYREYAKAYLKIILISYTYIIWFKLLSITFSINQNLSVKTELFFISNQFHLAPVWARTGAASLVL